VAHRVQLTVVWETGEHVKLQMEIAITHHCNTNDNFLKGVYNRQMFYINFEHLTFKL